MIYTELPQDWVHQQALLLAVRINYLCDMNSVQAGKP
jgi:hypothetical protein